MLQLVQIPICAELKAERRLQKAAVKKIKSCRCEKITALRSPHIVGCTARVYHVAGFEEESAMIMHRCRTTDYANETEEKSMVGSDVH